MASLWPIDATDDDRRHMHQQRHLTRIITTTVGRKGEHRDRDEQGDRQQSLHRAVPAVQVHPGRTAGQGHGRREDDQVPATPPRDDRWRLLR